MTDKPNWADLEAIVDAVATRVEMQQEINRLRAELAQRTAERDEARRDACYFQAEYEHRCARPAYMSIAKDVTQDAMRFASLRGWDCFKEAKP
jgi:hypothetical protein